MADIVLVHGIDQHLKSADLLEKDWLPALAGGVRNARFPNLADRIWRDHGPGGLVTRMAFYGHLFLIPGQQGDDPGPLTDEEEAFAEALAQEWLERVAAQASRQRDKDAALRELRILREEAGEEQGLGEIARKALNGLAKIRWFAPTGMAFAQRFVKRSLAQVTRYLGDESIRHEAQRIVRSLITPDTRVVIAHSLGSVVAFEALQHLQRPLPLLVTIGCPLGLRTIIYDKLRPQPPGFPPLVRRWVNVADRDDFIAAEPNLTNMFKAGIPAAAVFEGGYTVDNGAEPHSSQFYLSKEEVGRPVGQVLQNEQEAMDEEADPEVAVDDDFEESGADSGFGGPE